MRQDIQGVERAPSDTEDYLLAIGGKTPNHEPMWRLVLAKNVIWRVAGGKVWDENLSVSERGGFDFHEGRAYDNKPIRDESNMLVDRQRYPHVDGWILQKWFPPSAYSKAQWFASENCLPDGTPKLGPFPQFGDYETMGGPLLKIPTMTELYDFISAYYRGLASRTGSVESRIREAHNAAIYAKQKEEQRTREFADDYLRDKCSYLKSSSLEAGRIRTRKAEKLGIREHCGA